MIRRPTRPKAVASRGGGVERGRDVGWCRDSLGAERRQAPGVTQERVQASATTVVCAIRVSKKASGVSHSSTARSAPIVRASHGRMPKTTVAVRPGAIGT